MRTGMNMGIITPLREIKLTDMVQLNFFNCTNYKDPNDVEYHLTVSRTYLDDDNDTFVCELEYFSPDGMSDTQIVLILLKQLRLDAETTMSSSADSMEEQKAFNRSLSYWLNNPDATYKGIK